MVDINGKQYELVEISGRAYKALVDRMEKEFGTDWQATRGLDVGVLMLAATLKAADNSKPTEDELWDLPMRRLNELSKQAMRVNAMDEESEAKAEKN